MTKKKKRVSPRRAERCESWFCFPQNLSFRLRHRRLSGTARRRRVSGRILSAQVKAGSSWLSEETDDAYIFRPTAKHLHLWRHHTAPVVVLLCDLDQSVVYWESVSKVERGPKGGWLLLAPKTQRLDRDTARPRQLCEPIGDSPGIRVLEESDATHGGARRISIRAEAMPGAKGHNMAMFEEAAEVVRTLGETSTYYRDTISRQAFDGKSATVVFGFLYASASDLEFEIDWVCKFTWCHPSLPPEFRPAGLDL